jgi:hypothetical protein
MEEYKLLCEYYADTPKSLRKDYEGNKYCVKCGKCGMNLCFKSKKIWHELSGQFKCKNKPVIKFSDPTNCKMCGYCTGEWGFFTHACLTEANGDV